MKKEKEFDIIDYNNRVWYWKVYESLIIKSLNRGLNKSKLDYYTEKHHILPKCLGGQDIISNYCLLTFREHLIAHMLLSCMYPDNHKLASAVARMFTIKDPDKTNRDYEALKSRYEVTTRVSTRLIAYFREKSIESIRKANTGRIPSEETRKKRSEALKKFNREHPDFWLGKKSHSLEHKQELSEKWKGKNNPNYGGISEKHRKNLSISHIGKSPNRVKIKDTISGEIYDSISSASKNLNIPPSTINYQSNKVNGRFIRLK